MIDLVDTTSLILLGVAGALAVARVVRTGSLADKVLGADNFNVIVIAAIAAGAGITRDPTYLDVLVAVTMLGFIGNLTVARYIEERGARA
jgi:multicomponent Na+:H+ antiporter subunit F